MCVFSYKNKKAKYFIGSILYLSFLLTNERIGFPTKHFCTLVPPPRFMVPYLHQFYSLVQKINFLMIFGTICIIFGIIIKITIWALKRKKHHIQYQIYTFLVQIRCKFNVHFGRLVLYNIVLQKMANFHFYIFGFVDKYLCMYLMCMRVCAEKLFVITHILQLYFSCVFYA